MNDVSPRRMFLYLFYAIVAIYVIIAPAIATIFPSQVEHFFHASKIGFSVIPDAMWGVMAFGYGVYGTAKTYEKYKGVSSG